MSRRDTTALESLRRADPVIGALIDANPDYDPDAWLEQLPRMDAFGVAIALHRDDVVLSGDLALRKAIQHAYGLDHLPSQAEVEAIAEAWRPHGSLAVNYLFASIYGA